MGPTFFYKFLHQKTFLDRRNLILANGRSCIWVLPQVFPWCDGLPLLYPADRLNFGEDFDGLKQLLATLPPSERPNLLFDRYFFRDSHLSDAFEEMYEDFLGSSLWRRGYALWEDERVLEWNAPMDYGTGATCG